LSKSTSGKRKKIERGKKTTRVKRLEFLPKAEEVKRRVLLGWTHAENALSGKEPRKKEEA